MTTATTVTVVDDCRKLAVGLGARTPDRVLARLQAGERVDLAFRHGLHQEDGPVLAWIRDVISSEHGVQKIAGVDVSLEHEDDESLTPQRVLVRRAGAHDDSRPVPAVTFILDPAAYAGVEGLRVLAQLFYDAAGTLVGFDRD